MVQIYTWPREWHKFISSQFNLRTVAMRSEGPLTPRRNARFVYQVWTVQVASKSEVGPSVWAPKEAFFARLDGEVGKFRFSDTLRCQPAYNRRRNKFPQEPWSDNTLWSDGTGWLNAGYIPPSGELDAPALADSNHLVIRGLPPGIERDALQPGDLLEIRPNGIATETSNLYEVVRGSGTDVADGSSPGGRAGVEIRPRLRQNFAAGDLVVLHHPQGVFQLTDPDQGQMFRDANLGSFAFTAMEYTG